MALQKQIVLDTGIEIPQCYIRITRCNIDLFQMMVNVEVSKYFNEQSRLDGKPFIDCSNIMLPFTYQTSVESLYTYMKTLPEYSDAIDV